MTGMNPVNKNESVAGKRLNPQKPTTRALRKIKRRTTAYCTTGPGETHPCNRQIQQSKKRAVFHLAPAR